jgi:hypothetical protein
MSKPFKYLPFGCGVLVRSRASSGAGFSRPPLRRLRGRMCPRPCGTASTSGPLTSAARVGTVTTGTASAFDRSLAPRYGSDLLTLRLPSLCSWVTRFPAAQSRRIHGLCLARFAPRRLVSLARPFHFTGSGLLAGSSRRETRLRSGLRSCNQYPLGNCVGKRLETFRLPDSAWTRFLIAPGRSAPDFMILVRS